MRMQDDNEQDQPQLHDGGTHGVNDVLKTIIGIANGRPALKRIAHRCFRCQRRAVVVQLGERRCADHALRCESGWTGDRCTKRLDHDGPHSNE